MMRQITINFTVRPSMSMYDLKSNSNTDPKNSGGIKQFEIQMVSVSMLQKIFIKTINKQSNKNQQNIVVPVLPNGHSLRRS